MKRWLWYKFKRRNHDHEWSEPFVVDETLLNEISGASFVTYRQSCLTESCQAYHLFHKYNGEKP